MLCIRRVADAGGIAGPIIVRVQNVYCICGFRFRHIFTAFPRVSVSGIPSLQILHSGCCLDGKYKSRPDTSHAALKLIACRRCSRRGGWTVVKKKYWLKPRLCHAPNTIAEDRIINNSHLGLLTLIIIYYIRILYLFYSYAHLYWNQSKSHLISMVFFLSAVFCISARPNKTSRTFALHYLFFHSPNTADLYDHNLL